MRRPPNMGETFESVTNAEMIGMRSAGGKDMDARLMDSLAAVSASLF